MGAGNHAGKDVKKISHDAKTQYFSKVQLAEASNDIHHPVFESIIYLSLFFSILLFIY
jgi:hypothetical protein